MLTACIWNKGAGIAIKLMQLSTEACNVKFSENSWILVLSLNTVSLLCPNCKAITANHFYECWNTFFFQSDWEQGKVEGECPVEINILHLVLFCCWGKLLGWNYGDICCWPLQKFALAIQCLVRLFAGCCVHGVLGTTCVKAVVLALIRTAAW